MLFQAKKFLVASTKFLILCVLDSCKFLHDRGDYKSGWQLDREFEESGGQREGEWSHDFYWWIM